MASAVILTHPSFDRAKVENPVFRGKKRGCVNFRIARREILAARAQKDSNVINSAPVCTSTLTKKPVYAELKKFQDLYESADDEQAACMRCLLEAAITSEINRRTGIW
ncbi:hypothetical protein [Herbaspirillum seropedicae]|uniref:hypothetical protein n=1 Tax=Herbaspirillum seropedicae TaxID=964 RepID=UPI000863BF76|nr:hypothetical protein [Herbaspirillum seropedicae]AON55789.1 hypothetical protein Hsc_3523 [Herbaspirillum seropedicae]